MDVGDFTQLIVLVTGAFVFGRIVAVVAKVVERQLPSAQANSMEADERLRALEEECVTLRQELTDIAERQDFTERVLLQDQGRANPPLPQAPRERSITPH
jgi:hypothetical protein